MKSLRCFLFALVFFPAFVSSQAQPRRDAQAIQLLQRALAQIGGDQKAAVRDLKIEGTIASARTPDKPTGTFVAKGRGDDFSFETTRAGVTTGYRVLMGRGSFQAAGKTTSLQPFNTSGLGLDVLPLFSRWTDFVRAETKVDSPVPVQFRGAPHLLIHVSVDPTDKSEIAANNHHEFDLILDPVTGLVAALRFKGSFGPYSGDRLEVENQFADYRTVGGFLMPTRITRLLNGHPMVVLTITSVKLNNGFADPDFGN